MNASAPAPSLPPVLAPSVRPTPNALNAFGGIWRLTFRRFLLPSRWLTLAIGLGVLAVLCIASGPRMSRDGYYVDWVISFYLTFLVPALSFLSAGGAIRDEMKSGTVDYVLTRPIRKPAFLAFKYVAHTLCTQVDFLLSFGVVLTFGVIRDVPDLASIAPKLLFGQILLVAAFSALGFLGGVITNRYVVIGILYALIIEVGVGQIPTQLSQLSMTLQVRELLTALVATTPVADAPTILGTTSMLLVFCVAALGAAAAIFSLRELSGPSEA